MTRFVRERLLRCWAESFRLDDDLERIERNRRTAKAGCSQREVGPRIGQKAAQGVTLLAEKAALCRQRILHRAGDIFRVRFVMISRRISLMSS